MSLLKLHILFVFQELRGFAKFMAVCVSVCVSLLHTHVQQPLLSTVFFHTMTALSNPIKATQWASQHHSFICHSSSPSCLSLSLSLSPSAACGWLGGNWVGELQLSLPCFMSLSFSFMLLVVGWHLWVNVFYLAGCQDVYLTWRESVCLCLDCIGMQNLQARDKIFVSNVF